MALKLKLKVKPSNSPERDEPYNEEQRSPPRPSRKVKTESSDKISKPKHKKEKLKKLKLSLGKLGLADSATPTSSVPPPQAKPKRTPKVRIKPTRIPGEGYDSEAPDVEDDPLIEQGIVVRFLNDHNLDFVHSAVETGDLSNVNIKWITRDKAVINVNLTLYSARLIDLPTLTEIYKTVDKKNIFKTIDISQVLLVLHPINPKQLNMEQDFEVPESLTYTHPIYDLSTNKEIRNSKNVYRHGLSYAYDDVYRRFKPRKVNHRIMQDVEARVDELVKRDAESQESHYEYVDPKAQARVGASHSRSGTPTHSMPSTPSARALSPREADDYEFEQQQQMQVDLEADIDNALEQELAEALDSTSNNTAATVLMKSEFDNEDEEASDEEVTAGQAGGEDEDDEDEEEDDEEEEEEEDAGDGTLKEDFNKVKKLEEEIGDLEKAADKQKKLLSTASYKMMRMKFQSTYNNLKAQLDQKKRELSKIKEQQQKTQPPEPQPQVEGEEEEEDDEDDDEEEDADEEDAKRSQSAPEEKEGLLSRAPSENPPQADDDDDQDMENEDYGDLQDLF